MNDLLRDLVVEKKIAVFIDDVMIAMETEEGHDKIVKEVLRRLECCDNHLSQRQMITQAINLLEQISSRNFTRELDKKSLLN